MVQPEQLTLDIQTKNILGLLPGIDRKQSDKPFIVDGKNFLFNAKGPYSGWGRKLVTKAQIPNPKLVQSFRTNDGKGFIFTRSAIYGYDTEGMIFYPVYSFTAQTDIALWSECFVANKHYFARQGVGIVEYNPTINSWTLINGVDVPVGAKAVINVRGRLIILGNSAYAWSALDDPTNLTPSLTTGAGIQSTAILGGTTFKMVPLSDAGLVFTSKGIIIFEFSGGQSVFRHRVLTTKFKAVNAVCIQELDTGIAIFMDEFGLFTCDGREPEIFDALFSEYLSSELFKKIRSPEFANYRLCSRCPRVLFKVMVSTSGDDVIYEKAFIMYRPIGKFGTLDDRFLSFIELPILVGGSIVHQISIVDPDGFVYSLGQLGDINYIEGTTLPDDGYFWQNDFDWPASVVDSVYLFPSLMTVSAEPEWMFEGRASGWYRIGDLVEVRDF